MASVTPGALALFQYPRPEWVSPTTESTIPSTEPLVFKSVARSSGTAHFNVQVDNQSDFSTATNYRSDRGGFEYWDGAAWTAIPTAGMSFGFVNPYSYYRSITINTTATGANIPSTLTSFPVCVAVNSSSWTTASERTAFFGASNANGKRIRFYDQAGATLAYEVESYNAAGQTAIYWVNVPSIAGNGTTAIYVGYGSDPFASDQDQRTAVWDSNYKRVHHFGDSPTLDSTSNNVSLTASGTVTTGATGLLGKAVSFNGTSYYYSSDSGLPSGSTSRTVSVLMKTTPNSTWQPGAKYGTASSNADWAVGVADNNYWAMALYGYGLNYAPADTNWGYMSGYGTGGSSAPTALLNFGNANVGSRSWNTILAGASGFRIGQGVNGLVDEVRISSVPRSVDWLHAEYISMKATLWNGDGWLSFGAQQATVGNVRLTTDLPPGSQYIRVRQSK